MCGWKAEFIIAASVSSVCARRGVLMPAAAAVEEVDARCMVEECASRGGGKDLQDTARISL